MPRTIALIMVLTILLLPCLTDATLTHSLEQPSCDDNSQRADVLFQTIDRARACAAALSTYETELNTARNAYSDFLGVMEGYEWTQNRLCRWQRLVKEPPETREAHGKAFALVKDAHERLVGAQNALWVGEGMLSKTCGKTSRGTARVSDIGRDEL